MRETRRRSLAKTITWRITACINGGVVTSIMMNDWKAGMKIGVYASLVAIGLYYIHERVWNAVKWGKI